MPSLRKLLRIFSTVFRRRQRLVPTPTTPDEMYEFMLNPGVNKHIQQLCNIIDEWRKTEGWGAFIEFYVMSAFLTIAAYTRAEKNSPMVLAYIIRAAMPLLAFFLHVDEKTLLKQFKDALDLDEKNDSVPSFYR